MYRKTEKYGLQEIINYTVAGKGKNKKQVPFAKFWIDKPKSDYVPFGKVEVATVLQEGRMIYDPVYIHVSLNDDATKKDVFWIKSAIRGMEEVTNEWTHGKNEFLFYYGSDTTHVLDFIKRALIGLGYKIFNKEEDFINL
ncbi:MAG: hypothetical protein PHX21_12940 [bacterium]|nr:hypothetical protein [bacterium]